MEEKDKNKKEYDIEGFVKAGLAVGIVLLVGGMFFVAPIPTVIVIAICKIAKALK